MWGSPKASELPVEMPPVPTLPLHAVITQNFANAILHDTPLLAPGSDGINAVELINGMILAGKTGKTVTTPVDRAEYESLIETLKASSQAKAVVSEQRVTDPKFA